MTIQRCGWRPALIVAGAMVVAAQAEAQTRSFDIAGQPAATGIPEFARQAQVQILASARAVAGKRTRAVRGTMPVRAALDVLLKGTGLRADSPDGYVFTIGPRAPSPTGVKPVAPRMTPPARIRPAADAQRPQGFEEVIVTGSRAPDNDRTQMAPDAKFLLHTAGDLNDPLKALLNLPGIAFGGSDQDPPIVRGGTTQDNLYLVDGIPVPNLFHDLTDSIISVNTLRSFDLSSAAYPLRYGDATGGVIDISLRDPNPHEHQAIVDFSELKSGGLIEGPITSDIAAYASYRINLTHLFFKGLTGTPEIRKDLPQSTDYASRILWRGDGVRLSATALGSWDMKREVQRDTSVPIRLGKTERRRFDGQAVQLAVDTANGGLLTATAAHVDYRERTDYPADDFDLVRTESWSLRSEYVQPIGSARLTLGFNGLRDKVKSGYQGFRSLCDYSGLTCIDSFSPVAVEQARKGGLAEGYAGVDVTLSPRWSANVGGRVVRDLALDETNWEPRAGVEWRGSDALTIFARAGFYHKRPQTYRLLRDTAGLSLEQAQSSWQGDVGARWTPARGWRLQSEAWYKTFRLIDLPGGPLETDIQGESHGVDLLVAHPLGAVLDGWLALSHTINYRELHGTGSRIFPRYDVPWSGAFAMTWRPGGNWSFGSKLRVQSGTRYTPLESIGSDPQTGDPVVHFGEAYSVRLPTYVRFDLRVEKGFRLFGAQARFYADLINLLNRRNLGERSYSVRNLHQTSDGDFALPADEEAGLPRILAFGIGFTF